MRLKPFLMIWLMSSFLSGLINRRFFLTPLEAFAEFFARKPKVLSSVGLRAGLLIMVPLEESEASFSFGNDTILAPAATAIIDESPIIIVFPCFIIPFRFRVT